MWIAIGKSHPEGERKHRGFSESGWRCDRYDPRTGWAQGFKQFPGLVIACDNLLRGVRKVDQRLLDGSDARVVDGGFNFGELVRHPLEILLVDVVALVKPGKVLLKL